MNVFDVIVYLALAWAVINGWRRGFLLQLLSLGAIVAGVFAAAKYGPQAGQMMGLGGSAAPIAGFVAIFFVALIVVSVVAHLLRAVLRFSGLGVFDVLLGILFSSLKVGLVVSVLFSLFATINSDYKFASKQTVEQSKWFATVASITDYVTPYFQQAVEEVKEQVKI